MQKQLHTRSTDANLSLPGISVIMLKTDFVYLFLGENTGTNVRWRRCAELVFQRRNASCSYRLKNLQVGQAWKPLQCSIARHRSDTVVKSGHGGSVGDGHSNATRRKGSGGLGKAFSRGDHT